jgi:hypothetical protein
MPVFVPSLVNSAFSTGNCDMFKLSFQIEHSEALKKKSKLVGFYHTLQRHLPLAMHTSTSGLTVSDTHHTEGEFSICVNEHAFCFLHHCRCYTFYRYTTNAHAQSTSEAKSKLTRKQTRHIFPSQVLGSARRCSSRYTVTPTYANRRVRMCKARCLR